MDRGAWQATDHGITKELEMTEQQQQHDLMSEKMMLRKITSLTGFPKLSL